MNFKNTEGFLNKILTNKALSQKHFSLLVRQSHLRQVQFSVIFHLNNTISCENLRGRAVGVSFIIIKCY